MLRGLRQASSNWLGKTIMATIMGVLIISFGIWGIADTFRGFGRSTLARIGHTEIGIVQFRQAYTSRLQQFGQRLGRPMSSEQARQLGVDRQLLQEMIAEASLDERAHQLGLGLSNAAVAASITQDPTFRGISGKFDPERFAQIIDRAGFTEARYVAEQRRVMLRRQLAGTVAAGATAPAAEIDALRRYQTEERSVAFVRVGAANIAAIDTPSPETLTAYFNARKAEFRAPEYRKVLILPLLPENVAKTITIDDATLRKAYDDQLPRLSIPEKREVSQIMFPSADEAKAARARIDQGLTFEALAEERKLKPADINLGLVTKSTMIDPTIANAAFALPAGAVSEPVTGRFGTALLKVGKIEPGSTPSFDDIKEVLRKALALDEARRKIQDIHDKIEDERAGGATLIEIGSKLGLPVVTVDAVDRAGNGPDGKPAAGVPAGVNVVASAFATDPGVDNEPLPAGNGYVWFDVAGVTPAHERTFDEVKDRVAQSWRDDEIAQRVKAKADELSKAAEGAGTFDAIAAANNLKIETASGLKRAAKGNTLPAAAVAEVFQTAKGGLGVAEGPSRAEKLVFKVTDVTIPPPDPASDAYKALKASVDRAVSEDIVAQYVVALEKQINVTINPDAFAQATGATAN